MLDKAQIKAEIRSYLARNQWNKAIAAYRDLLDIVGENPNIYNLIGDLYIRIGDLNKGIKEYSQAIESYTKEGLFDNAVAVCKKVLRLDKNTGGMYFRLAELYAQRGLANEAIESLTSYVEKGPNKTEIEGEIQRYRKTIVLLQSNEKLLPELKDIYLKMGYKDRALDELLGIVHIEGEEDSEDRSPWEGQQVVIEQKADKKFEDEEAFIEEATIIEGQQEEAAEEAPGETPLLGCEEKRIGVQEEDSTQNAKTSPYAEEHKEHSPGQESQATLEEDKVEPSAKEKVPLEERPRSLLSLVNEVKDAVEKGAGPRHEKDHYQVALVYKEMGLNEPAIEEFQQATKEPEHRSQAFKMLGLGFLEQDEPKLAINAFQNGLNQGDLPSGNSTEFHYNLGRAYEALGEIGKAIKEFEAVYFSDISYQDVKERLKKLKEKAYGQ